jgi:dTDP-4-dehydrorhamnose reductase
MLKLLVTGREGQLAQSLLECATEALTVIALGRPDLDLANPPSIRRALDMHRPDVVVNAAAYTHVDKAETEPDEAVRINARGAGYVAEACADAGVPLIHISTDYVFDGEKCSPYVESDAPGPLNAYGRSKLAGEQAVLEACPRPIILRTGWIHSPFGRNFVTTMLRLAQTRSEIAVIDDQHGTPTYAPDLATAILAIAQRVVREKGTDLWGVYHISAEGETTWCGLAREVFRRARDCGGPTATVRPIPTSAYPTPARRPLNGRLEAGKLARTFGLRLPHWTTGVERCVRRLCTKSQNG